jgi:hypothetical protein
MPTVTWEDLGVLLRLRTGSGGLNKGGGIGLIGSHFLELGCGISRARRACRT